MWEQFINTEEQAIPNSKVFDEFKAEIDRYCPFLEEREYEIYYDSKPFFNQYKLLRLEFSDNHRSLYGFFTEGDFWPLDFEGVCLDYLLGIDGISDDNVWNLTKLRLFTDYEMRKTSSPSAYPPLIINEQSIHRNFTNKEILKEYDKFRKEMGDHKGIVHLVLFHDSNSSGKNSILKKVHFSGKEEHYRILENKSVVINRYQEEFWTNVPKLETTRRITSALPVDEWDFLLTREQKESINDILRKNFFSPFPGKPFPEAIFRAATLPFFRQCKLLEAVYIDENTSKGLSEVQNKANPEQYKKTYALVEIHPNGSVQTIYPLSGRSNSIHTVKSKPNELQLNEETVEAYLRFFCWAVHGELGPFLLARSLHELNFLPEADKRLLTDLKKLEPFKIAPFEDSDYEQNGVVEGDGNYYRRAYVFYGNSVFIAWFKILGYGEAGVVEMINDTPYKEKVGFYSETYSGDYTLFSLQPLQKVTPRKTEEKPQEVQVAVEPEHWIYEKLERLQEGYREAPITEIGSVEFFESLGSKGLILGKKLREGIVFDNSSFTKAGASTPPGILYICNCDFSSEQVEFRILKDFIKIYFVNCVFGKGIQADYAQISSSLYFIRCAFPVPEKAADAPSNRTAFSFRGGNIAGSMKFFESLLRGEFHAPHCKIGGSLSFRGCQFSRVLDSFTHSRISLAQLSAAFVASEMETYHDVEKEISKLLTWKFCRNYEERVPHILCNLENARIRHNLEFTIAVPEKNHDLTMLENSSHLDIASGNITVIDGALEAPGMAIGGSLILAGSFCSNYMELKGARIQNGFVTSFFQKVNPSAMLTCQCFISGYLSLDYSTIEGAVAILNYGTGSDVSFTGSVINDTFEVNFSHIGGNFSMLGVTLNNSFSCYNSKIGGSWSGYGGIFDSYVSFMNVSIGGNLDLNFATIKGFLTHFNDPYSIEDWRNYKLEIKGDFRLSQANINSLELRGITVGKDFICKGGNFKNFKLSWGLERINDVPNPVHNILGRFQFISVTVAEDLELSGVVIQNSENRIYYEKVEKFIIRQCRIGGDLCFRTERLYSSLKRRHPEVFKASSANNFILKDPSLVLNQEHEGNKKWNQYISVLIYEGNMDLSANSIGGDLNLTNCVVEQGKILLHDTKIGKDLKMAFVPMVVTKSLTPIPANYEDLKDNPAGYGKTVCLHLDMEKLECQGDVDLTGLHIKILERKLLKMDLKGADLIAEKEALNSFIGTLNAKDCVVRGELRFVDRDEFKLNGGDIRNVGERISRIKEPYFPGKNGNAALPGAGAQNAEGTAPTPADQEWTRIRLSEEELFQKELKLIYKYPFACIEGSLSADPHCVSVNLSNGKFSHLIFTEFNIPCKSSKISLARCEIGRMEVIDPCPGPIDLSKIRVSRWVFGEEFREDANQYIEVLTKMSPLDRGTWIDVENSLRNRAQDDDANEIFRRMKEMEREDTRKRLKSEQEQGRISRRNNRKKASQKQGEAVESGSQVPKTEVALGFLNPAVLWNSEENPYEYLKRVVKEYFAMPFGIKLSTLINLFHWVILIYVGIISVLVVFAEPSEIIKDFAVGGLFVIIAGLVFLFLKDEGAFLGTVISFGTQPKWPIFITFILTFPVLFLFLNPKNVRLSSDAMDGIHPAEQNLDLFNDRSHNEFVYYQYQYKDARGQEVTETLPEIHPYPAEAWKFQDAVVMTAKYQIPIVSLFTHDRWTPSSRLTGLGITVEQFMFCVNIYNWLAWPIFLIGMTAEVFRGKKN